METRSQKNLMPLWFQTRTRYSEDVTNLKFAKHEGTWAESTIIINSMMVLGKLDLTIESYSYDMQRYRLSKHNVSQRRTRI